MKDIIRSAVALFIVTAIAAALLGTVSAVTAEPIRLNKEKIDTKARLQVMPSGEGYDISFDEEPVMTDAENSGGVLYYITAYNSGMPFGYVINVTGTGYGGAIELFVGITNDGRLTGIRLISHSETPGLGANAAKKEFYEQFVGKSGTLTVVKAGAKAENEIDAITAATITSSAVTEAVNTALAYFENQLRGGVRN